MTDKQALTMTTDRKDDLSLQEYKVAGNGLLDRRLFLKKGLQFGAITTLASSTSLATANSEGFYLCCSEKILLLQDLRAIRFRFAVGLTIVLRVVPVGLSWNNYESSDLVFAEESFGQAV